MDTNGMIGFIAILAGGTCIFIACSRKNLMHGDVLNGRGVRSSKPWVGKALFLLFGAVLVAAGFAVMTS
jgi:hypothetical protein